MARAESLLILKSSKVFKLEKYEIFKKAKWAVERKYFGIVNDKIFELKIKSGFLISNYFQVTQNHYHYCN